jgi:hypothetical protein
MIDGMVSLSYNFSAVSWQLKLVIEEARDATAGSAWKTISIYNIQSILPMWSSLLSNHLY